MEKPKNYLQKIWIERFRTDAVTLRPKGCKRKRPTTKRGKIQGKKPSAQSLQNLIFILNNSDVMFRSMLTLTFRDVAERKISVLDHRQILKNALERLRKFGAYQYVWVREFQEFTRSVHWHIFTDLDSICQEEIDREASQDWSDWLVNSCLKKGCTEEDCKFMRRGDGSKEFPGCCRWERLRGEAAGRYCGKEGGKRFQKYAPERWIENGGGWWRASRSVKCTPIDRALVTQRSLHSVKVKIPDRDPIDIITKYQYGKGTKKTQSN